MPERYADAILKYLADRRYQPLKPRQLARQMGVADEEYGTFRTAVKQLHDAGRIAWGAKNALVLPDLATLIVGFFRGNPRGFGFVVPEEPNAHRDLFIPPEEVSGALTGDLVQAEVIRRKKRGAETIYSGRIVKILKRGRNRFVGTLQQAQGAWFVLPDGTEMTTPIVIRDAGAAPKPGMKLVVEILRYGQGGELPEGVIVETLGEEGELAAETDAVVRAFGLAEAFPEDVLAEARSAVENFKPAQLNGREDLTGLTVITIDPPDARDYDDAISLSKDRRGQLTLGVHIADVSHFVREGGAIDREAVQRGTSVYFPRRVLPMLPEVLSNGVCSLQENQPRFTQSAMITYDEDGRVVASRVAESVIRSAKRLTYVQAQEIIDGKAGGYDGRVVELVKDLEKLARVIEARRRKAGMIHLDLPEVELVFNDAGKVVDAVPADDSYTHTMIEMFMVEANEAVASLLNRLNRPCLRRIHPAPDAQGHQQLKTFLRACGHKLPRDLSRKDLQELLARVRGRPESYAVNLAVLRTFEQAEYSPRTIGHYALASEHYCHFTSPIRRYPDLTIHRLVSEHCRHQLSHRPPEDMPALIQAGANFSAAEKRAESAERELRQVLVLQMLAGKVGESFPGVITGVTNFGMFVQSSRWLVEGLIRMQDLGDDWWDVSPERGQIRGQRTGRTFRIGDVLDVRIVAVDIARRQLNLLPERSIQSKRPDHSPRPPRPPGGKKGKQKPRKKSR